MTVEHDLSARLSALADELTWPDPGVSAEAAVVRHRRQRRTRAGVAAAVAAVAALVVAVPTATGALSADPGEAARPGGTTAPSVGTDERTAEEAAAEAARSAAQQAADERDVAEFAAGTAALGGPLQLSSPAEWDQWLPMGRPYPGASREGDGATCPQLSDALGAALGMPFGYWQGTLPHGPSGCTWVPVPMSYSGPYDYPYLFDVGFVGHRTVDELRSTFVVGDGRSAVPGDTPCPAAEVSDGSVLLRCGGPDEHYDAQWVLLVPDARGAGVWVLSATARTDTGRTSADALAVLVGAVRPIYG